MADSRDFVHLSTVREVINATGHLMSRRNKVKILYNYPKSLINPKLSNLCYF